MAGLTTVKNAGGGAAATPASRGIKFTRASLEKFEPFADTSTQLTAATQALTPIEVPAVGYLRGIYLYITAASGADDGTPDVAAAADSPWNLISELALKDVSGGNLFGPVNGFDLFLINKWGAYANSANPLYSPVYSAVDVNGNFSYVLYIPAEIVARNAFGSLINQNATNPYRLHITLAAAASLYDAVPGTTLPTIRVRAYISAWAKPSANDPAGNPQEQLPPGMGTTQYWTKSVIATAVGENTLSLPRKGNYIRTLILTQRDDSGVREGADLPADSVRVVIDGYEKENLPPALIRHLMQQRYGYDDLEAVTAADDDEGVLVYPFSHDWDGKPGSELGDLWMPTAMASRLEINGTWQNTVGTLEVLTNDIAPAPGIFGR